MSRLVCTADISKFLEISRLRLNFCIVENETITFPRPTFTRRSQEVAHASIYRHLADCDYYDNTYPGTQCYFLRIRI